MVGIGVVGGFLQGMSDSVKQMMQHQLSLKMLEERKKASDLANEMAKKELADYDRKIAAEEARFKLDVQKMKNEAKQTKIRTQLLEKDIVDSSKKMSMEREQLDMQKASAFLLRTDQEMGTLDDQLSILEKESKQAQPLRPNQRSDQDLLLEMRKIYQRKADLFKMRESALSGFFSGSALQSISEGGAGAAQPQSATKASGIEIKPSSSQSPSDGTSGAAFLQTQNAPPAETSPDGEIAPGAVEGQAPQEGYSSITDLLQEEVRNSLADMPGVQIVGGKGRPFAVLYDDTLATKSITERIEKSESQGETKPVPGAAPQPTEPVPGAAPQPIEPGSTGRISVRPGSQSTRAGTTTTTTSVMEPSTALEDQIRARLEASYPLGPGMTSAMAKSIAVMPKSAYARQLNQEMAVGGQELKKQLSQLLPSAKFVTDGRGEHIDVSQFSKRQDFNKLVDAVTKSVNIAASTGDESLTRGIVNSLATIVPDLESQYARIGAADGWFVQESSDSYVVNPMRVRFKDYDEAVKMFNEIRHASDDMNFSGKVRIVNMRLPKPSEIPKMAKESLESIKPGVKASVSRMVPDALKPGTLRSNKADSAKERAHALEMLLDVLMLPSVVAEFTPDAARSIAEVLNDKSLFVTGYGDPKTNPGLNRVRLKILEFLGEKPSKFTVEPAGGKPGLSFLEGLDLKKRGEQ
jgi:hypothetical protein